MEDELHPVVELLLARMNSHPEEFVPEKDDGRYVIRDNDADRWWRAMSEVQEFANEQEKKVIAAKLRELRLQQAHEWAMDELCNGDERRRREKEEAEYERSLYANRAGTQQVAPSRHPTFTDMENNGIVNTLRGILK